MKKKRAPWPRWAKILRNLLLAVLLGVMMWDLWDQPSFSYAMALRRRERQMLVRSRKPRWSSRFLSM